MTTDTLSPVEEEAVAVRPAARWRNWWRTRETFRMTNGRIIGGGKVLTNDPSYHSKPAAEHDAHAYIAQNFLEFGNCCVEYLGAFPEGERPDV
jgi:hypothetical protein